MPPQAIDLALYRIAVSGCNGSRRRRFSLDNSRRLYYARFRQSRFAGRLRSV